MFSIRTVALLFVCAVAASASTIVFEGAPTGVNDGADYVLPYQVSIDGTTQLVDCFDMFDNVNLNDTWTASLLNINQAATSDFFSDSNNLAQYERVAWLAAQSYSTTDQQIGLQYAIWSVFGTAPQTAAAISYEAAADSAAANNYAGFDFDSSRFIQQVGAVAGAPGTEQAFVFQQSSGGLFEGEGEPVAPEPGTIWMLAGALAFAGVAAYRKRSLLSKRNA